jgi:hypothetical protein
MPVDLLYVEGSLEVEVLYPILLGAPVLKKGGSKGSLRPRATTERIENHVRAGYLRDRDFDYDPPADLAMPTIDHSHDITGLGDCSSNRNDDDSSGMERPAGCAKSIEPLSSFPD